MAKFKNLEMCQALLNNTNLTVKNRFFGLKKQLVYIPTSSPVKIVRNTYNAEAVVPLRRIIESDPKGLAAAVKAFHLEKQSIGNVELDICVSDDKNFVALQMLQFGEQYCYHPVTSPVFFEGEQAQLVAQIL